MDYKWELNKTKFTKNKGSVFSCFSCGGGSTMGYKLAGFNVIGCNEIDPKMMDIYKLNHNPEYSYLQPIQEFKKRNDLPAELYNLDILDGSPPCSSFSLSGNRSKDWGKEKKFKEGQSKQILDTLFYDFIDLANKLKPKVVISENVKGLISGDAIKYVREIYKQFNNTGYYCQHFLLNSTYMGIPQRRERVFFICLRKDIANKFLKQVDFFTEIPEIKLNFKENEIPFIKIKQLKANRNKLRESYLKHWENSSINGRSYETKNKTKFGFFYKAMNNIPLATITAGGSYAIEEKPELLTTRELCLAGSYPIDYNFKDQDPQYIIGMSVPPLMIKKIATEIFNQWLNKL